MDSCWMVLLAGSGKTLAFLLPIVAVLHQQKYDQWQQQQESAEADTVTASIGDSTHADHQTRPTAVLESKRSRTQQAEGPAQAPKGNPVVSNDNPVVSKGSPAAAKGPGAVVLAPSRELAAQTARCLLLLLKGMKLRCTLLTAAVAAGTDFSKVSSSGAAARVHSKLPPVSAKQLTTCQHAKRQARDWMSMIVST